MYFYCISFFSLLLIGVPLMLVFSSLRIAADAPLQVWGRGMDVKGIIVISHTHIYIYGCALHGLTLTLIILICVPRRSTVSSPSSSSRFSSFLQVLLLSHFDNFSLWLLFLKMMLFFFFLCLFGLFLLLRALSLYGYIMPLIFWDH